MSEQVAKDVSGEGFEAEQVATTKKSKHTPEPDTVPEPDAVPEPLDLLEAEMEERCVV